MPSRSDRPSLEEAKKIVQRLTQKYGYLNPKMMADIGNWNPEYRREIDENWLAIESTAAHSVKTLAKHIYGSGARFVFEILQNADDCSFDYCDEWAGEDPYIDFEVHPDRIVIKCNEDGFTERDLEAICAVGQSTKSTKHGYIGAKGIGFKSVFIAAWKVHIQSANFSFEFRHRKSDPGLGMVRPIWVDTEEKIYGPLTKMTLYLHDQGNEDELRHLRSIIVKQFEDLQQTSLLFLRKIQSISIGFYDDDGELQSSKCFDKKAMDDYRVTVRTNRFENDEETTETQMYHITTRKASGLTRSDNRDAPDDNATTALLSTAEIVLAFPLTADYKPMIQGKQELFAFLPIRESDYRFLIHTDFDTSANRQDIVTTSRRNRDLLEEIAETLVKAVLEFCEHPSLCYNWPLFLPDKNITFNAFWSDLNTKITSRLKETPCVKSRNRGGLRLIRDVVILATGFDDENGRPLLDDEKDRFISSRYGTSVTSILKAYGLEVLAWNSILDLLRADLQKSNSKMRSEETTGEWHSRMAGLLHDGTKMSLIFQHLKELPLIPLRDGSWTSANHRQAYLPSTKGIAIPSRLGIPIVSRQAVENDGRNKLFEGLGVQEAAVDLIRQYVSQNLNWPSVDVALCREYLHYLYLTHKDIAARSSQELMVRIHDSRGVRRLPRDEDMYLSSRDGPFTPERLLAATATAEEMDFTLVHPFIMHGIPTKPSADYPTWDRWLYDCIGVRERMRLLARDGSGLSEEVLFVFNHRKDAFLELLAYLWSAQKPQLSKAVRTQVKKLSAKELCPTTRSINIADTWLPRKELIECASRYTLVPEKFPFLNIEPAEGDESLALKWNFLRENFSVGWDNSIQFLLQIVRHIKWYWEADEKVSKIAQLQRVCDLYRAILARLTLTNDASDREIVKDFFYEYDAIVVLDEQYFEWCSSDNCLWNAPPIMRTRYTARSFYADTLVIGTAQFEDIERLVKDIVGLRDASLDDIDNELRALREIEDDETCANIKGLYEYLISLQLPKAELREAFDTKPLIYVPNQGTEKWFKASECLWSSAAAIHGKAILEDEYGDLKDFFVEDLGVESLTLQMLYDQLREANRTDVDEVRGDLLTLSRFLEKEADVARSLDPGPILRTNIFPVRYANGSATLRSRSTAFAIGDRQYLKDLFDSQICRLDFNLEETRSLAPLIQWAGLEDRYLSHLVQADTFVSESDGRPIVSVDRDLSRKAYHILRLAATYKSPRYEADPHGLYGTLRAARVVEVRNITSVLKMTQNQQTYTANEIAGKLHVSDTSCGLIFYVPRSRKAQDVCFSTSLPEWLAGWLMENTNADERAKSHPDAVATLISIFSCRRSALDDVLDRRGVLDIDVFNLDIDDDDESEQDEDEEEEQQVGNEREADESQSLGTASESQTWSEIQFTPGASSIDEEEQSDLRTPTLVPSTFGSQTVVETMSRRSDNAQHDQQSAGGGRPFAVSNHDNATRTSIVRTPAPALAGTSYSTDDQYVRLLQRVIDSARGASFPAHGAFDMSSLQDALPGLADVENFDGLDIMFRFRSAGQLDRDKKIGAAGELYLFELLSTIELPNWGRGNWQSTIRTLVNVHHEYDDLTAWGARETADLVYDDTTGQFTNYLIGHGYLNGLHWGGYKPKYYLEVKTTTGPCNTPFYMSDNQYRLMRRIQNDHTEDRSIVYLICRVFQINSDRIGMRIYIHPERLRRNGQLRFTAQTWCVTPGDGTPPQE